MGIAEFLEARIAEDEAAIDRRGDIPHSVHLSDELGAYSPHCPDCLGLAGRARVLAECAAKRAVIDLHRPEIETVEWFDDATGTGTAPVCPSCRPKDPTDWNPPIGMAGIRPDGFIPSYTLSPCPTLCALAAVYKDHPEYQAEWAL